MRIEASTRLTAASSRAQLLDFVLGLNIQQRHFFYMGLPTLIQRWFYFMKKNSDHLSMQFASNKIEARSYKEVDALAVALGHVRHIYTPKMRPMIYRSLMISAADVPTRKTVNFKSAQKWGPMQSWTYHSTPEIFDRRVEPDRNIELVLETKSSTAAKHVLTDYIQLGMLCNDAMAIRPQLQSILLDKGLDLKSEGIDLLPWSRARRAVASQKMEKEVLLYIPSGTSLRCAWRAFNVDKKGRIVSPYQP